MAEKDKNTKYEKARIIGARALQISMGAPPLIKLEKEDYERMKYNPIKIASSEFEKDLLPLAIRRPVPDTRKRVDREE